VATGNLQSGFLTAASQETFQLLLEGAPDAIILCDSSGTVQFANDQTKLLFGYDSEELIGKSIDLLVPSSAREDHHKMRDSYGKAPRKRPMGLGLNLSAQRKDGSLLPVEISLSPVTISNDKCVLAIVRDVTELRQLTRDLKINIEELRRSNEELEQFAYVASHDLQEPLRMVSGYTQLLLKRYANKLDDDAKEFIDFAVDGAKRMQNLINDLLSYSRVHSRKQPATEVDLNIVLQQVQKNLITAITESNARIISPQMPVILADPVLMTQLFQNIIANAIKFRKPDTVPEINITVTQDDERMWTFAVRDNGIGIRQEYADRIFAVFQRLHTRDAYPGTGIGLAICKKIVEKYQGKIWVHSEPENGSTFYFTLENGE
jgi:PAS domain S-box-containing protein